MSLKVPLLQRYILGETLKVFVFVLTCITVLLVFVGVFQQAAGRGLTPIHAVKILPFVVPSMLPFTIPAAMLLTVSVVYGRIAGDQEVIAAKAAGIHPVSLMWPAFFLGALLSAGSLVLADQMIPWSITKIEQHAISVMEDLFLQRLKTERQFSDHHRGLHIHVASVEGRKLIHPVIRYSRGERVVTMEADEALIRLDMDQQEIIIQMKNGFIEFPGNNRAFFHGERTERLRWERDNSRRKAYHLPIISIESEIRNIENFRKRQKQLRAIEACLAMTTANFDRVVDVTVNRTRSLAKDEYRFLKLNTEIHSRFAMACSCLFFTLLGTPVAISFGKSQFATSFLFCFLPIVCGYYPLMLGLMSQAKHGNIAPEWAMWFPNFGVIVLAWFAMRKVIRY